MAKIKETKNGNIKVTMTTAQYELVNAILWYARLGMKGNAALIADLAIAMSKFSGGDPNFGMIKFTTEDRLGNVFDVKDVTIETV